MDMTLPISMPTLIFLLSGLIYSLLVSWLAFRRSGELWMLFLPHWIDARSGIPRRLRRHGFAAFGLLFVATIVFYVEINR